MTNWADRTKQVMRKQGITQDKLSEMIGYSQSALSHWFSGRRTIDLITLEKIAVALGTSVASLVGDSESAVNEPSPSYLTDEQLQIIDDYESLSPANKRIVDATIAAMLAEKK